MNNEDYYALVYKNLLTAIEDDSMLEQLTTDQILNLHTLIKSELDIRINGGNSE